MSDSEQKPDAAVEFAHQIFDAARTGDVAFVISAVDQGVPRDLTDEAGNTILMLAAYHGHADLVDQLARRGADVNRLNDRGQSPLAGAVFKKSQDVITVLLQHGADVDLGNPSARATAAMFHVPLGEENVEDVGEAPGTTSA